MTFLSCLLFFLMLVFPYMFMGIKILIILIIIFFFIHQLIIKKKTKINLDRSYIKWILLYWSMNLLFLSLGILRGNPGVNYYWTTNIIWPILYLLYCILIDDEVIIKRLFITSYIAYITIICIGILVFLQGNNFIPTLFNEESIGFNLGDRPLFAFQSIQGGCIVSFIFLFPFYLSMFIMNNKISNHFVDLVVLILSFIFLFATSRRALILSLIYLPILIYIYIKGTKNKFPHFDYGKSVMKLIIVFATPFILILLFSLYIGILDTEMLYDFVLSAFTDDNVQKGTDERSLQFIALIEGWLQSPFWGAGTGVDTSITRSEIPGAYELSYVALLFERGIIGFIVYALQFIYLLIKGKQLSKCNSNLQTILISYNVAFISFLIANASNPYLGAYDHLWVLFLFVALQNIILKKNQNGQTKNLYFNQSL